MNNSLWKTKILNANRYYKQWSERFKCDILEDYWECFQWRQVTDIPYYKPYVVNLIYAEIKRKLSNILYQNLTYDLTPRPGHYGYNPDVAFASAQDKQDFLNETIARANQNNDFNDTCHLFALDSFFRFGVMELGYAADWRNPSKKPLVTTAHDDSTVSEEKARVVEDEEVPENERIYFKRIKASRFRVSTSDDPRLSNCSWCGYYSFIYKHVLKKTKSISLPSDFESSYDGYNADYIGFKMDMMQNRASSDAKSILELMREGKVCKVWNIWDNEIGKRFLLIEPSFEVIWEDDISILPFVTHRHDFRLDGWYPMPPVYNWIAPQDEINQAREQMRNYRRRFTRKFKYWGVDQDEIEKFKSEIDGEVIKLKTPNSIIEGIANPEIGISITEGLTAGRDDFNIVSGSSSDLSSVQADRATATQSKITATKAAAIESVEQINFASAYKRMGGLALYFGANNLAYGTWVKNSMNPGEQFLAQLDPNRTFPFRYITSQQLNDGFDVDIEISCNNASPQRMEDEFNKYVKFLTMTMNFPMIMLSPTLIRETAYRCGYRNERVIAEMQRAALLAMVGQVAQGAQNLGANGGALNGGGPGNVNNTNMVRNAAPAAASAIDQQLINQ